MEHAQVLRTALRALLIPAPVFRFGASDVERCCLRRRSCRVMRSRCAARSTWDSFAGGWKMNANHTMYHMDDYDPVLLKRGEEVVPVYAAQKPFNPLEMAELVREPPNPPSPSRTGARVRPLQGASCRQLCQLVTTTIAAAPSQEALRSLHLYLHRASSFRDSRAAPAWQQRSKLCCAESCLSLLLPGQGAFEGAASIGRGEPGGGGCGRPSRRCCFWRLFQTRTQRCCRRSCGAS